MTFLQEIFLRGFVNCYDIGRRGGSALVLNKEGVLAQPE